jgi:hypothetical protein
MSGFKARMGGKWDRVDLGTVRQCPGHSEIEPTMKYLKPARNQAVQKKVNDIFA